MLAFCAEDLFGFGEAVAAADVADYHFALPAFAGDGGGVEGGGHGAGVAFWGGGGGRYGGGWIFEDGAGGEFAGFGGFGGGWGAGFFFFAEGGEGGGVEYWLYFRFEGV